MYVCVCVCVKTWIATVSRWTVTASVKWCRVLTWLNNEPSPERTASAMSATRVCEWSRASAVPVSYTSSLSHQRQHSTSTLVQQNNRENAGNYEKVKIYLNFGAHKKYKIKTMVKSPCLSETEKSNTWHFLRCFHPWSTCVAEYVTSCVGTHPLRLYPL